MRWKWILGIFAFLIIALVVVVYAVLATYDYNKLKPRIAQMVKGATGRELNLNGEVNLAIGFSPALVVTGPTFATAAKRRGGEKYQSLGCRSTAGNRS